MQMNDERILIHFKTVTADSPCARSSCVPCVILFACVCKAGARLSHVAQSSHTSPTGRPVPARPIDVNCIHSHTPYVAMGRGQSLLLCVTIGQCVILPPPPHTPSSFLSLLALSTAKWSVCSSWPCFFLCKTARLDWVIGVAAAREAAPRLVSGLVCLGKQHRRARTERRNAIEAADQSIFTVSRCHFDSPPLYTHDPHKIPVYCSNWAWWR